MFSEGGEEVVGIFSRGSQFSLELEECWEDLFKDVMYKCSSFGGGGWVVGVGREFFVEGIVWLKVEVREYGVKKCLVWLEFSS